MKKAVLVAVFLVAMTVTCFAGEAKKSDTVFQKASDYARKGYKKDFRFIDQMAIFQMAADWIESSLQGKNKK